jgi:7-cyano-7-deazaguanine synthase
MSKLCIASHSGGLDSSTVIARAIAEGYIVQPINFFYGQKNAVEEVAQENIMKDYKERYKERIRPTITIDIGLILGPFKAHYQTLRDSKLIEEKTELEYYTPFRNLVFSSICAMLGELIALTEDITEVAVAIGIHKHSTASYKKDYWDITPEFAEALDKLFKLNDVVKFSIYAPYADKFKEEIIRDALELEVPYNKTWSCYDPQILDYTTYIQIAKPCLKCEACLEREMQAINAGVDDINDYELIIDSMPQMNFMESLSINGNGSVSSEEQK